MTTELPVSDETCAIEGCGSKSLGYGVRGLVCKRHYARPLKDYSETAKGAAPPSPPVAPEPAQETWSQPELNEVEKEATAMHAVLGNAEPAQENPFPHIRRLSEIMEQPAPVGAEERVSEPWRYHADDMTGRHCDGCHEYGCSGLTNELPQAPKENHEVSKASSGEAAGDGVTHPVGSAEYWHSRFSTCLAMLEQAEREAAGLREQVEGYRDAWCEACGEREKAKLAAEVAETEAEIRRLALVAANGDRDAERAQKEEQTKRALLLGEEVTRLGEEREALRAERDELKAKLGSAVRAAAGAPEPAPVAPGTHCLADIPFERDRKVAGVDVCRLERGHTGPHRTALLPRAPAAPVAKEEATAEPDCTCPKTLVEVVEEAINLANMTDAHTRRHFDAALAKLEGVVGK